MLRSGPACSLARASLRFPTPRHASHLAKYSPRPVTPRIQNLKRSQNLALVTYRPLTTSLQRHAAAISDKEAQIEKEVQKEELVPHPEEVTSTSTVHQVFHEKGVQEEEEDIDMLAGVKSDLVRPIWFGKPIESNNQQLTTVLSRELSRKPLHSTMSQKMLLF